MLFTYDICTCKNMIHIHIHLLQEFRYAHISISELAQKTLDITVWDHDLGSSNDYLGEKITYSVSLWRKITKSF